METVQADLAYKDFYQDEDVIERTFDPATGRLTNGGGTVGYYTEDNLPYVSDGLTDEEAYAQAALDAANAANGDQPLVYG